MSDRRLRIITATSPVLAIVVGIVCQELILKVSIPSAELISAAQPTPGPESDALPPMERTSVLQVELPALPMPTPGQPQCASQYFAVFHTADGTQCVKNPTLKMAHWGPPTAEWFRSRGGRFAATLNDLAPQELCACLQPRAAFPSATTEGSIGPVRHLELGGEEKEIEKWVCGDECIVQTEIVANDP